VAEFCRKFPLWKAGSEDMKELSLVLLTTKFTIISKQKVQLKKKRDKSVGCVLCLPFLAFD
jgi:hypothetical protein